MEQEPPDLIRKLAALANHPNTPPHEAAAAREKLLKLLAKHGLTEEDISNERTIWWDISQVRSCERDLLSWVISMLLDTLHLPGLKLYKQGKDRWKASILSTATDRVDILACFSYYRKILQQDRTAIQEGAALKRSQAKELVKAALKLTAGMKMLPEVMRSKYELYPPSLLVRAKAEMTAANHKQQKPEKLSPAERRRRERENEAWRIARMNASHNDAWQKGEGLKGDFALEG